MTPEGEVLDREIVELDWDEKTAEKGGFETFMLKEIHEQADAVAETIADRTVRETGVDFGAEFDEALLRDAKRIIIVACGTSYHSGVFGRYAIQNWARVPVGVDIASEFRYADPLVGPGDIVIGMTQSGETADTLAAMRVAQEKGATVIASRTSWARRPRATPTRRSSPAPARRSASRRRRRSPARSR